MSWSDPCNKCGEHRADCNCVAEPPTQEDRDNWKREEERLVKGAKICAKEGHKWEYTFIIYACKRCGETTEY